MKQTNNAIKFLMAQYRAIFKNANLKMFLAAATAAAALSATQAQAAADYWTGLSGSGLTLTETKDQSGDGEQKAKDSFSLSIGEKGKLILAGDSSQGNFKLKDASSTGFISLDGGELDVGNGKGQGATLELTGLTVNTGTAHIGDATAAKSELTAKNIVIGAAPKTEDPQTPAVITASTAKVIVGKSGSITATGDGSSLIINNGGELNFAAEATAADSKVTSTNGISVQGGTISVTDSGGGTIEGKITSNGGSIVVGGENNNTALTITDEVVFNGEGGNVSIAKSGSLILSGSSNLLLNLGSATVSNAGTIEFKTLEDGKTATVNVSSTQFNDLFKGKVKATAKTQDKGTLKLVVAGSDKISLDTILDAQGALAAAKLELDKAKLDFEAKDADVSYTTGDTIKQAGTFTFGTLTAGKTNALTLSGSSVVNVTQGLNVDGGLESGTLTIKPQSLILKAMEQSIRLLLT